MKRYLIFIYYSYEPNGGMQDFYTDYEGPLDDAKQILFYAIEENYDSMINCGHVYDTWDRKIVYSTHLDK